MPLRSSSRLAGVASGLCLSLWWSTSLAETQLSVYTGSSFSRNSDLRISQPGRANELTLRDVQWDARPFHPAPYYGLRAAHFADPAASWGIALDYTHYKMYARTDRIVPVSGVSHGTVVMGAAPMKDYVQQFELSHGVNLLSVNAIWRAPATSALRPYLGAGAVHYRPHSENQVDGLAHETGYVSSGFGYQVLAGAQYRVTERAALFVEAKFNSGTAKVGIAGGRAETPLRTTHLLGGVSFDF